MARAGADRREAGWMDAWTEPFARAIPRSRRSLDAA